VSLIYFFGFVARKKRERRVTSVDEIPDTEEQYPMSAIHVPSYHPASIDQSVQACKGRRTDPDHAYRGVKPYIYSAFQCRGYAVQDGYGLCSTCDGHRGRGVDWHGRVDEPLNMMPANSHIAGGPWFHKMVAEGKFKQNDRPLTAKQEGRLSRAPIVPEAQLRRFVRGEIDLDIETLAARRQISAGRLINIIGAMGIVISRKVRFGTKAGLCAAIRAAMAPPLPAEAAPQHFNPEEDNFEGEAEAFEPEVQQMAYAGDETPSQSQAQAEAEAPEPQRTRYRFSVDWSQLPSGTPIRWVIKTSQGNLTSMGVSFGCGGIVPVLTSNPQATWLPFTNWINSELTAWKIAGHLPAWKTAPHNAWKALEFKSGDTWVRLHSIRSRRV
jgi:hypothetical protein